jgi:hypothetical protein
MIAGIRIPTTRKRIVFRKSGNQYFPPESFNRNNHERKPNRVSGMAYKNHSGHASAGLPQRGDVITALIKTTGTTTLGPNQ